MREVNWQKGRRRYAVVIDGNIRQGYEPGDKHYDTNRIEISHRTNDRKKAVKEAAEYERYGYPAESITVLDFKEKYFWPILKLILKLLFH